MLFQCPHCSTTLDVPDDYVGRKGRCIECRNPIIVPDPQTEMEVSGGMVPPGVRTDGAFEYECMACGRPLDPPFAHQCPACKALLGGSAVAPSACADEGSVLPSGVRYANAEQSEYECAYCGWPLSPPPFSPKCSQCGKLLSGEVDASPASAPAQLAAAAPPPPPNGRHDRTQSPGLQTQRTSWWADRGEDIAEFTSEYALWGGMLLVLAIAVAWIKLTAWGRDADALLMNAGTVLTIMTAVPIVAALLIFLTGQLLSVRLRSGALGIVAVVLAAGVVVASPSVGAQMVDRWAQAGADACALTLRDREWSGDESPATPWGVAHILQDQSLVAVTMAAVGDTKGPEGYARAVAVLVALGVDPDATFSLCNAPAVHRTAAFVSLSPSTRKKALSQLADALQTTPDRNSLLAAATAQMQAEAQAEAAYRRACGLAREAEREQRELSNRMAARAQSEAEATFMAEYQSKYGATTTREQALARAELVDPASAKVHQQYADYLRKHPEWFCGVPTVATKWGAQNYRRANRLR